MKPTYRNRKGVVLLFAVVLSLGPFRSSAWSYEVETHAEMSRAGYISANVDGFLSEQLGLSGVKKLPRSTFLLERPRPPVEWLAQGSRDEDDGNRYGNHFYDPIYDRGLTTSYWQGARSYEWALETPTEFNGQEFSYRDARRNYFLSLTEQDPKVREQRLADTFYSLGHVIHLIQDMASPAHCRNAPHAGLVGPLSVVEKYLDLKSVRPGLKFDGYPIPKIGFAQPRDFWVETDTSGLPTNGPMSHGLSQIINRNFVSEGTNFAALENGNHGEQYANPILDPANCYDEEVKTQDATAQPVIGLVTFCGNSFTDPNTGVVETNPRMTTFSLFSRDLSERGKSISQGKFSLNGLNALSIGQLTIPRAVSYSAGLLNYFFRGRFTIERLGPAETAGVVRVAVRNGSDERMAGKVTLYYDDPEDHLRKVIYDEAYPYALRATSVDIDLGPGEASDEFNLQTLHVPTPTRAEGSYMAVFVGKLGLESDAVAAARVSIAPPRPGLISIQGGYLWWLVNAPGVMLTLEGSGTGNNKGTLEARALNSDGDLVGDAKTCCRTAAVSFGEATSVSISAPAPPRSVMSGFYLEVSGQTCLFLVTPQSGLDLYGRGGYSYSNCPE